MVKAKRALLFALIALFIFVAIKPASAEDLFQYRDVQLNQEIASSTLFLTPVRARTANSLTLDLMVDPAGEQINTVSTEISFPADKLSLLSLGKTNSFCSFFVEEKINNTLGKIKISCLAPFPGTNKMSNVVSLTFKKIGSGSADLSLSSDSLVLANDGYGTNVLQNLSGQTVALNN
jgi:hypothetical protein